MKWQEIARNLPQGHKTRADCPQCGEGTNTNAAIVNHNHDGYSLYCNACGHNPFESKGKQTLEELRHVKELNEAAAEIQAGPIELPKDYSTEIPLVGRLWLYSGGITESVWRRYHIGYSERQQRVVLPVYNDDGDLVWYQCRAVLAGQKPKYLQPSRDRSAIMFASSNGNATEEGAVVVEDILSAIRVGRHRKAFSLLGTKVTSGQANVLANYSRITTWMDSDRAGRQGAANIRRTLGIVTDVRNILTELDPKALSDVDIKEQLDGLD